MYQPPLPSSRELSTSAPLRKRLVSLSSLRQSVVSGLHGEPGIGKSRTAQDLLASLSYRHAAVRAICSLADLVGALPDSERLPAWSRTVLERACRGDVPDAGALPDALAAKLSALAPFVLLVEDLHETATVRRDMWCRLATVIARTPGVGLLVTSRSAPPELFEAHLLEPLSEGEIVRLLEVQVGAELPAEAVGWIAARACGNPLFALEYFRQLARQGHLWSDSERWRWREPEREKAPTSVEALISQRLKQIGATGNRVTTLRATALLPREAPAEKLAVASDLSPEEVRKALHELRTTGILREDDFAHPLYREIALQETAAPERRRLARRALAAYADDPLAAARFIGPAALPAGEALPLLERAVDSARESGDRPATARLLAEASDLATGEKRERLGLQAAEIYRDVRLPDALALTERLLHERPDNVEARFLHAELLVLLGRGAEADLLVSPLETDDELHRRWLLQSVILYAERGEYQTALAIWRSHPDIERHAFPRVVRTVAFAMLNLGELDEAESLLERQRTEAPVEAVGRAELLHARAAARFYRGDYAAAEQLWAQATEQLQESDERVLLGRALGNRVAAFNSLNRYPQALPLAEEAVRVFADLGLGRDYSRQRYNLANLLRFQADFERAEEMLLECRDAFERFADTSYLLACEIDLAYLYISWSPPYAPPLALKHANSALAAARAANLPGITVQALTVSAQAEAYYGDPATSLAHADEAIAEASRLGQQHSVAAGTFMRGHALEALGRRSEALEQFRESSVFQRKAGNAIHAESEALEIDRLTGNREAAMERVRFFESRGLLATVQRAYRYFPELRPQAPELRSEFSGARRERLTLEVLGPIQATRSGRKVDYRARKGKELLGRLLEARMAGRSESGQLELQEALYPSMSDQRASSALQQLVYRLRSALGNDVVIRTQDGYTLGKVDSDAEEFLVTGNVHLWRGCYLEGVAEGWEPHVSHSLQVRLREQVEALLAEDAGLASRLAGLLLAMEPYDEDLLRLVLRASEADGDEKSAERIYIRARAQLAEVGTRLPDSWRRFLAGADARR